MRVSLKTAFSILDGRLSTDIGDVYKMLNYIFSENFYTHQLPGAMQKIEEVNPDWFSSGIELIKSIKEKYKTDDFKELMNIIDKDYPDCVIELEKIKTIVWFQMQSEDKPERVIFTGCPTPNEVKEYFETQCGGVYKWWI